MKKINYILFPILISLLLLFPIFKENISSIILILLCINTIVYKVTHKDYSSINYKTLLLTIPFWIIVITSLFTNNYTESGRHIQHSLFFLIVPVVFSLIPKEFFNPKKIELYIGILKNLCLIIAFIYIGNFLYYIPLWKLFLMDGSAFRVYIYSYFNWFVIHPSYYTTLLILCTSHSIFYVINEKKYWQLVYVFVFYLITFLLLTKLNFVLLNIAVFVVFVLSKNINYKIKFIVPFLVFTLTTILIIGTPGLRLRFEEIYNSFGSKPKNLEYNSTSVRKAIFDCSIAIYKEDPLTGVGFENLQDKLNECYKSNYDSNFYTENNYMTHNYYLYILISSGIFGFIFYLFYLFNIVRICLKSKLLLFSIFLFNALIICFTEDYFYRQFGSLYFNVMLMLFIRFSNSNEEINFSENSFKMR